MRNRPRVLWIPHAPWAKLGGQRQQHLIRRLARDFEVHVLSWIQPRSLVALGRSRTYAPGALDRDVVVHEVALAPNAYRLAVRGYPPQWAVAPNQVFFRRHMRRVVAEHRFDVGVFASSHHFTGFPLPVPFPVVFDYVDLSPRPIEAAYCGLASAVLAASPFLADRAAQYCRPVALVPNGVDLALLRMSQASGVRLRVALGLGPVPVVSLIGLTASPSLYFVDAVARLVAQGQPAVFLAVGEGSLKGAIAARAAALGVRAILPGWVPPQEIAGYFGATDVGLYPGEDTPYFHAALPLKVLEYGAAGKPVVSTPVDAYDRLGLSHVRVAPPTAAAFARAMGEALRRPAIAGPAPGLESLDWDHLARRAATVLEGVLGRDTEAPDRGFGERATGG